MNNFDIFVDSIANLTEQMMGGGAIRVIPMSCFFDGREVVCGGDNYLEAARVIYSALEAGKDVKTALVSAECVQNYVEPTLQAGRDALIITTSSKISGTFSQAKIAAENLMQKYEGRRVVVCDSLNASLGEGLLAVQARRLRELGESIESCAEWVERHKLEMNSVFTVRDLKWLKKGGRISPTLAFAGTILNIKPVLRADGAGRITFQCNERGRKKALLRLCRTFEELCINPENQTVAICHADCEDDANLLADMLRERGAKDVIVHLYDVCSVAHVGPGTIALFFMGKERAHLPERAADGVVIARTAPFKK